jgi:carboxylesterase type B
MVGHNADEGLLFTSPFITSQSAYAADIQTTFPDISLSVVNYLDSVLYPPDFSGAYGYTDQISRVIVTISEYFFVCNTFYLDLAYNNQTYAYQFSIPPALHGEDIAYTYYNDGGLEPGTLATLSFGILSIQVALALQDWIVTFVRDGVPSSPDVQGRFGSPEFVSADGI